MHLAVHVFQLERRCSASGPRFQRLRRRRKGERKQKEERQPQAASRCIRSIELLYRKKKPGRGRACDLARVYLVSFLGASLPFASLAFASAGFALLDFLAFFVPSFFASVFASVFGSAFGA